MDIIAGPSFAQSIKVKGAILWALFEPEMDGK
jgi:hypothetical protein